MQHTEDIGYDWRRDYDWGRALISSINVYFSEQTGSLLLINSVSAETGLFFVRSIRDGAHIGVLEVTR